jgi:hypothetical protein
MAEYKVQHAYSAWRDGHRVGPWAGGESVDLDEDVAEWVNRDSPGTLAKPRGKKAAS